MTIQTQLTAIAEAIQRLNTRMDIFEERYWSDNPVHLYTNQISKSKPNIASTPPFGAFTHIPKVNEELNREFDDDHLEVKRKPDTDQIEELVYEPNPDDFYFSDYEDDDQIVGKPLEEIITTTESVGTTEIISLDGAQIFNDIIEVPVGTIGMKSMPQTYGASVDFVFPTLKPLPQVGPFSVFFQHLQVLISESWDFYLGKLCGDTRFLPPLTRVHELWERLEHLLCSWPGD